MGSVWEAEHASGERVAVKVLTASHAREPAFVASLRNEVRAGARLDHPHIVLLLDAGFVDAEAANGSALAEGSPWLAMELVRGGPLDPARFVGEWDEARTLLLQLLSALAHAHARGVTHRDLTPANVLLAPPDDERPGPRLMDFGLALDRRAEADAGTEFGSLHFMAPEQRREAVGEIGPWTDLYALGCIAWELITGRRPFGGDDVYSVTWAHLNDPLPPLRPRFPVPGFVEGWLRRMLARDPRERFRAAAQAASVLRGGGERPPLPRRTPAPVPARLGARTRGSGLGLFGLRPPPLAGRGPERSALWEALGAALGQSAPQLVLVRGAPGVGASRLASWIANHAAEDVGARVLWARHAERPEPGLGVAGMLGRSLRCHRIPVAERPSQVEAELRALGATDPVEWVPLATLVQRGLAGEQARLTAQARRDAARSVVRRMAARRPLVLVLDDVHHGPDALTLAEALLDDDAGPVLLVLTARDDALASDPELDARLARLAAHPRGRALPLGPLPTMAMFGLVAGALDLEPGLARQLVERADGNPQFAVQLIGEQLRRGLLQPTPRGHRLVGEALALPGDVHALWEDRLSAALDELPAEASRAVEAASALGLEVDEDEWRQACAGVGLDPATPDLVLERLVRHVLARPTDRGWRFVHSALRECCARRAEASGTLQATATAAGRAVRALRGESALERAGRLLLLGEAWLEAADALLGAAEKAGRTGDWRGARGLLERLEAGLEGAPVHETPRVRPRLALGLARAALVFGELDRAEGLLHEVLGLPGALGAEITAATGALGSVARLRGRHDEARLLLEEARSGCEHGPLHVRARVLHELAMMDRRAGRHAEAANLYRAAAADYASLGDVWGAARCEQGLGFIHNDLGRHAEAAAVFQGLLPQLEALGDRVVLAATIDGLAAARFGQGDLVAAGVGHLEAWTMLEETGAPMALISALNYATVLLEQGELDEARLVLGAVGEAAASPAMQSWRSLYAALCLPCDAARGDWVALDAHRAEVEAEEHPVSPRDVVRAARLAADVTRRQGERGRAEGLERLAAAHAPEDAVIRASSSS